MRSVNKFLTLQNIFFIYIIAYSLATIAAPEVTIAKYMAAITHSYDFPLAVLKVSILFSVIGLFRHFTPMSMWFFLLPFIAYCGFSVYAIMNYPTPTYTGVVNCIFFIVVSIVLTWERING